MERFFESTRSEQIVSMFRVLWGRIVQALLHKLGCYGVRCNPIYKFCLR